MKNFKIYYLGVGSATPSLLHQPSCQVLDFRGRLFMIDCGEGAQLAMRRMKLKFSRLEHIFISHLHGDHFFGLPGLLSTLALHDVGGKITVHISPDGVEWLSDTMERFCNKRSFELVIEPIPQDGGEIYNDGALTVTAFPLYHRIPCNGFIFRSAPGLRKLKKDMVEWLDIPIKLRQGIKEGADYIAPDGRVFLNNRLTDDGLPASSYAYCSDTVFNPDIAKFIRPVDTIYHEATYLECDIKKAEERFHSTASQAVKTAVASQARLLVLGHYSKSYTDLKGHLDEARKEADKIDPDLQIITANEGDVIEI